MYTERELSKLRIKEIQSHPSLATVYIQNTTGTIATTLQPRTSKKGDGCRHIYLDVGSNVGVQVRKLFEPHLYPDAPSLGIFERYFGQNPGKDVCVFGFELNPDHMGRLKEIETCYNARGWRTHFHVPVAVMNTKHSTVYAYKDPDLDFNSWGTSIFPHKNTMSDNSILVPTIDLAEFILEELVGRIVPYTEGGDSYNGGEPTIYAKFDIEGAEHGVLAGLIAKGALCHITHATIEWHHKFSGNAQKNKQVTKDLLAIINLPESILGCQPMTIQEIDDEMYYKDGAPLSC